MVCASVRSIIPSLKLGDYLSVQAHKLCSITYSKQLAGIQRLISDHVPFAQTSIG